MLRQFVSNTSRDASGHAAMMYREYLKDQMTKQRLVLKYMALVAKGMYVTDLEVDQAVAGSNVASGISYIVENYNRIADSTVSVTKEDIRKYYDAHKNAFRQSASRDVEYVMFDVLPSGGLCRCGKGGERNGGGILPEPDADAVRYAELAGSDR